MNNLDMERESSLFFVLEDADMKLSALCGGLNVAEIYAETECGSRDDLRHNLILQQLRCLRETADNVRAALDEAIQINVQQRAREKQSA